MKQKLGTLIISLSLVLLSGCASLGAFATKFSEEYQRIELQAKVINAGLNELNLLKDEILGLQSDFDYFRMLQENASIETLELYKVQAEFRWQMAITRVGKIYADRGKTPPQNLVDFKESVEKFWSKATTTSDNYRRLKRVLSLAKMLSYVVPLLVENEEGSQNVIS